jgi:hypothetical protein
MSWITPAADEINMDAEIGSYQEDFGPGELAKRADTIPTPKAFSACALVIVAPLAATLLAGCACSSAPPSVETVTQVQSALGSVNWLTRSHDNNRTATNSAETLLNQSNVTDSLPNVFGKTFDMTVDDAVWAQILYASSLPSGYSGLYVATANNSLYAFVATSGAQLWAPLNFGTPVLASQLGSSHEGCSNFNPASGHVGIIGTPVINGSTSQLYLVAHTWENNAYNTGAAGAVYRLVEVNITNGTITKNVVIAPPTSDTSWALYENQRTGLALSPDGKTVYVAFGSYCDRDAFHGWMMAFDTTSLNRTALFNATPNGAEAGIWQSGQAPAVDSSGNVYVATGNGDWSASAHNYGESVLKLSPTLKVSSYFTQGDWSCANGTDLDLGVTGPVLLPGYGQLIQGSKEGKVYVLEQSSLGGMRNSCSQADCCAAAGQPQGCNVCWNGSYTFDTQIDQVLQADPNLNPAPNPYYPDSLHDHAGTPVWNGPNGLTMFIWHENDEIRQFTYNGSTKKFSAGAVAPTLPPGNGAGQGGFMSISANGSQAGTGLVWATSPLYPNGATSSNFPHGHGILYALNAENLNVLWDSTRFAADDVMTGAKWTPPTIANGTVYAATFSNTVNAYGLRGKAHLAAYFDGQSQLVYYPDTTGNLVALKCGPGGCWNQSNIQLADPLTGQYPMSAIYDGSTGHVFPYGGGALGELVGSPPSSNGPITWLCGVNGCSYNATPEAHASAWDGTVEHVYFTASSTGAPTGAGALHEMYRTPSGTWNDHTIPQCPYTEFGNGPRYVTAYWDGSVQHVIFDCVNDQLNGTSYPHELWETYYNGNWWTHAIASTANGQYSPAGYFMGAYSSASGVEGILGLGPAGSKTLVYTSFVNRQWGSVSISVPSLTYNSTVLVYPDSTGLRAFFVGENPGHVYAIQGLGSTNTVVDLSSTPGQSSGAASNLNNVAWTSDLAGYTDGTNDHVFFIGADGYIHEFYGGVTAPFSSWFEHRIGSGKAFIP